MKINKKGFTLIELLAVIVVLGIIIVIAIPTITGTLNDAKEGSAKIQAQKAVKAMRECYIAKGMTSDAKTKCADASDSGWLGNYLDAKLKKEYQHGEITDENNITVGVFSNNEYTSIDKDGKTKDYYKIENGKDGITYTTNASGGILLEGEYTGESKNIAINNVYVIKPAVFLKKNLESVLFKNVQRVSGGAFKENQLKNVWFDNKIYALSNDAFANNQLTNVTFSACSDEKGLSIGTSAFANNQLTTITLPACSGDYALSIGLSAFANNQLTTVTFSANSNLSIGSYAFSGNNNLTTITLPANSYINFNSSAFAKIPLTKIINKTGEEFDWVDILSDGEDENVVVECLKEDISESDTCTVTNEFGTYNVHIVTE